MHRQTLLAFRRVALALATSLAATSAAAADTVDVATPIAVFDGGTLVPKHAIAWKELAREGSTLVVYLVPQEIPEAIWLDAENRDSAIGQALEKARAAFSIWRIGPDGQPASIMNCNAERACMGDGISVINGIATARSTLQADGGRLRGRLESGSGVCGEQWCEVTASVGIDVALAPPPLPTRVAEQGSTGDAQAAEASAALTAYWTAAGKAKRSTDLDRFFTAERTAAGKRQDEQMGDRAESAFVRFFVPAHAGKLDVRETRVLGDAAVARVKTRTRGEDARDMECRVLLRKQDGAWKIGPEEC